MTQTPPDNEADYTGVIVFCGLSIQLALIKLLGIADMSWWWVASPILFIVLVFGVFIVYCGIVGLIERTTDKWNHGP